MTNYTIATIYSIEKQCGEKIVLGSDGSVQPISVLDRHRMCSNEFQIGLRWWNDKFQDWSYEVLDVRDGTNVTRFIEYNEQYPDKIKSW